MLPSARFLLQSLLIRVYFAFPIRLEFRTIFSRADRFQDSRQIFSEVRGTCQ